jgi:hypothetical protein
MDERKGVHGRWTRAPLDDVRPLFASPEEDAWGYIRPPYSPQLMRLATELSAATYEFDFSRFFAAGWMDATLQVENRLFAQVDAYYARKTPGEFIRSGMKLHRAKSMLSPSVTDVLRAMRQLVATDTGKAVVMAMPAGKDRFAIAISFMGTGRKFYDWFTNFKMSCRGGIHEGFLNTARLFDRNSERIQFPRVAQALGRSTLTLADVLTECTQPASRFRLFLCGHSQGGAVAQAYGHLLRDEHALAMENVAGYTLGAPTLVSAAFPENPAVYPLYHLINTDDFVPRMGASMRLGVDMRFVPDVRFRQAHYGYAACDDERLLARDRLRAIMGVMQDMPGIIEIFVALLRALSHLPDPAQAHEILQAFNAQLKYLTPAMQSLGLRSEDLLRLIEKQMLSAYRDLTNRSVDEARIAQMEEIIARYILGVGASVFSACFGEVAFAPHQLTRADGQAPYQAIAAQFQTALRPMIYARSGADETCGVRLLVRPGAWYGASEPDVRLETLCEPPRLSPDTDAPDPPSDALPVEKSAEKTENTASSGNNER